MPMAAASGDQGQDGDATAWALHHASGTGVQGWRASVGRRQPTRARDSAAGLGTGGFDPSPASPYGILGVTPLDPSFVLGPDVSL